VVPRDELEDQDHARQPSRRSTGPAFDQRSRPWIGRLAQRLARRGVAPDEGIPEDIVRLAYESMAEGVIVADRAGRVLLANAAAERVLGKDLREHPVDEWPARYGVFLHDGKNPCPPEEFPLLRAVRGESLREVELFVRNGQAPDGVWIRGGAHPLTDESGTIHGGVLVFRDVTTRRRAETTLRDETDRQHRHYRRQASVADIDLSLMEASEVPTLLDRVSQLAQQQLPADDACIILCDTELESLTWSPESAAGPLPLRRMSGLDTARDWIVEHRRPLTVADTQDDPFHPERQRGDYGAYAGVPLLDNGTAVGVLFAADRKPRHYSQDDLDFLTALADRATAALSKVRLYERLKSLNGSLRHHGAELRENEQRFRALADNAPVLIWMTDDDAYGVYYNRTWLEFTGRTLAEEIDSTWTERLHPDDYKRCVTSFRRAFDARLPCRLEYRLRREDGAYRWMLGTAVSRQAADGTFLGYIGSCLDLTERRAVEAERARHHARLEVLVEETTAELENSHKRLHIADRLAAIGTLTAGLGHDMNNVLFPVRCRLDALQWERVPADLRDTLRAVSHAVDYLQQLTDGLRLLALDPEDAQASAQLTGLAEWWPQVSPLLIKSLPKNVELVSELPARLPPVRMAPHALTQALLNLVINAGEALPDGGSIRVWARVSQDERWVRVGVSDEGVGMTEDVRRQAFDPFFTTKKRSLSTGLGLSLVHSVVTGSQGTVDVTSTPGAGTTIVLSLPAAWSDAPSPAPDAEDRDEDRGEATVSIADPNTGAWIVGMLRSAGYRVDRPASEGPGAGVLWVTEASPQRLDAARRFLDGRTDRRILVLGPAPESWRRPEVIVAESAGTLDELRTAISAAGSGGFQDRTGRNE